ncbi:MAG: polysaccharide deacetylase family protein [Chitinophagaceae bacterium]
MQLLKRIRYLFEPRALVLMYHRIAEVSQDPWQLAVSPENFEQHLKVLQRTGKLIPVKTLVKNLHQKSIDQYSICVTFDDGYSDNYLQAKPLLEKYKCAASFFIPTLYPGRKQQFWWDELESILLCYPKLPVHLTLSINGTGFEFDLKKDDVLTNAHLLQHKQWVWPDRPPNRRCELYLAIWELIKPLQYDALQSVLSQIKNWASFKAPSSGEDLPMTREHLKDLISHPLIDLGMHTVTHTALSYQSFQIQKAEISESKRYLENLCARSIDSIAYPYGSYNDLTLAVAKDLHLYAAFTTAEKLVTNHTNPFQIGRFQVKNWNGNEFERWLLTWKKSAQFL